VVPDEEELTPLEEEMPLEVEELAEDDCEESDEEVLEAEFDVLVLDDAVVDEVDPGIVAALTALNRPTPATAAKAAA